MAASDRVSMRLKDRAEYRSKPKPLTSSSERTVSEAVSDMCQKGYGSVIVVDDADKPIGIVTERDLMRKIVDEKRDPRQVKLEDIMTTDLRLAREDDDVVEWLRIMSNERFRRLPVVDAEGRIKAVFSQGDFVSYTWPELMGQAGQLARATIFKNWHIVLIGGGIMLYTILMLIVLRMT